MYLLYRFYKQTKHKKSITVFMGEQKTQSITPNSVFPIKINDDKKIYHSLFLINNNQR